MYSLELNPKSNQIGAKHDSRHLGSDYTISVLAGPNQIQTADKAAGLWCPMKVASGISTGGGDNGAIPTSCLTG